METRPSIPDAVRLVADLLIERGAREVYIFGSVAKGKARETSDLDFALVGLPQDRYLRTLGDAMDLARRDVDLIDFDAGSDFGEFLRTHGRLRRAA